MHTVLDLRLIASSSEKRNVSFRENATDFAESCIESNFVFYRNCTRMQQSNEHHWNRCRALKCSIRCCLSSNRKRAENLHCRHFVVAITLLCSSEWIVSFVLKWLCNSKYNLKMGAICFSIKSIRVQCLPLVNIECVSMPIVLCKWHSVQSSIKCIDNSITYFQ